MDTSQTNTGREQTRTQRALGVRAEIALSASQLRSLEVLQSYDLNLIRQRLRREAAMPETWLDDAIFEFRRYMALSALHEGPLPMMSHHVDRVWHTCLLFSALYADLCEQAFGYFLHHEPNMDEESDGEESWRIFQEAYEKYYGRLAVIWLKGRDG